MSKLEQLYDLFLNSSGISTDSRKIETGSLFFALKGENFDGNLYASDAIRDGACCAVIDNEKYSTEGAFLVDDVLETLQMLARHHRNTFDIPVIALTGTNGKTTTKELIRDVLAKKYETHATRGNLNNHIGVPLTLLGISSSTQIAVVEMGANHQGEIAELCSIALPTHGMITNIGKAHLEGFGGYEGVIKAKSEMYDYLRKTKGKAFVNQQDDLLMNLSKGIESFTYGDDNDAGTQARINNSVPFLNIIWNSIPIPTQLYGDYNFQNIAAAICIGSYFEVEPEHIVAAISDYTPKNNRSQVVKSNNNTIYLDAYNANPSSMLVSIRQFIEQEGDKKVLILGDMLELGDASMEEHSIIINEVKNGFHTVILVGPEFCKAYQGSQIGTFQDTDGAAAWIKENSFDNAQILIKGSRGIALEKLLPLL